MRIIGVLMVILVFEGLMISLAHFYPIITNSFWKNFWLAQLILVASLIFAFILGVGVYLAMGSK